MIRKDVVNYANSLSGEEGHQEILNIYNSQKVLPRGYKVKYTDAWCATFVSAVFIQNGYSDIAECSCPKMIEKAKKLGIWKEDDDYIPQIGDIIMYDWQDNGNGDNIGTPDHVGIVTDINKYITIREGNKGGKIDNRQIFVNSRYIRGYILPPYEAEIPKDIHKYQSIEEIIDGIINNEFGSDEETIKNHLFEYFKTIIDNK